MVFINIPFFKAREYNMAESVQVVEGQLDCVSYARAIVQT